MIRKKKGEIVWYEFELLQDFPLVHGVFTRNGGVSHPPFESLNLGEKVGDNFLAVEENKHRLANTLNIELPLFITQIHSNTICEIYFSNQIEQGDGMITAKKEIPIAITHADCQAAIFYDKNHHVVANIHAGWRGNVQNIYAETVKKMGHSFGTRPQDLIVCISPSLGPSRAQFIHYNEELPQDFWVHKNEGDFFNLWNISKDQLKALSICDSQIEIASMCTFENKEEFFSYRRDKETGRNATVVALL